MPVWQGKSRGTTLGYRIFVGVLKKFRCCSGLLVASVRCLVLLVVFMQILQTTLSLFPSKNGIW